MSKFVSLSCQGELCFCGLPAEHKVEETIFADDPMPNRHPLTAYVCRDHFRDLMGPAADNVLHAFQKKSKHGIATPKHELDRVRLRLKTAEQHYKTTYEQVHRKDEAHERGA